jgi:phosphohistidine phosphatase
MAERPDTRELLLLRHGIAEERDPGASPEQEAARPLTTQGRRRTRAVLERFTAAGLRADRLLSSPLQRACQTAELAIAAGMAEGLELAEPLAPGGDSLALLESLWGLEWQGPAWNRLLLVGHEPDLGLLAARLLGAPEGSLSLKKAGLALLHVPPREAWRHPRMAGNAQLKALLTPRLVLQEQR